MKATRAFFLFIAILATCAAILTVLFLDRSEWPQYLRKSLGSAAFNFGVYYFLRWAEKTAEDREKQSPPRLDSGNEKGS